MRYPNRRLYGVLGHRLPEAYAVTIPRCAPTFILGPYLTPTGGADYIQPYELIPGLIKKYAARGNVIFEGVLISGSYGQVGALLETYGKQAVMVFLDTSLEDCIRNVKARRSARADGREFNPKNLTSKYKSNERVRKHVIEDDKITVVDASMANVTEKVLALLRNGTP